MIEGDLETSRDAERIARLGVPAVQINTQGGCHLDAAMIQRVLDDLPLKEMDVLFIENVGNLVCPADYDLGETQKVALLSVAEGDDKPAKYPYIFRQSGAAVVTKMDLLPHTDFSLDAALRDMRIANPRLAHLPPLRPHRRRPGEWVEWIERLARGGGAKDMREAPLNLSPQIPSGCTRALASAARTDQRTMTAEAAAALRVDQPASRRAKARVPMLDRKVSQTPQCATRR